jgi:polyhydroxyalkanoate synthesis regulator phasin
MGEEAGLKMTDVMEQLSEDPSDMSSKLGSVCTMFTENHKKMVQEQAEETQNLKAQIAALKAQLEAKH